MLKRLKKTGLAVAFSALAAPAFATTLADALVQAYLTNPQILAQQAALRATDEGVISARANLLPTLQQSLQLTRTVDYTVYSNTNFFPRNPTTQWVYNTQLTIQLYDGGADRLGVQAARMAVLAGRQALLLVEQTILFNTVQAFMNVRRDQQYARQG